MEKLGDAAFAAPKEGKEQTIDFDKKQERALNDQESPAQLATSKQHSFIINID